MKRSKILHSKILYIKNYNVDVKRHSVRNCIKITVYGVIGNHMHTVGMF